uniref:hypothetical protein n=1 Tax=Agathobacter sp. TaxID=2021311 RepID=UPI004056E092
MLFKVNTWGEEAFLDKLRELLQKGEITWRNTNLELWNLLRSAEGGMMNMSLRSITAYPLMIITSSIFRSSYLYSIVSAIR